MKCKSIRVTVLLMLFALLLISCDNVKHDPEQTGGIWSGSYSYDCKTSAVPPGSSSLTMEITQHGNVISGTATYLGGVTSLTGMVSDNTVYITIAGSSVITQNRFTGTVVGDSISGTTANGEGCSAPSGPAGTFNLTKSSAVQGPPVNLTVVGPDLYTNKTCALYTVETQDISGSPSAVSSNISIALSGEASGKFYQDENCSAETSSLTIPASGMSQNFFFKDAVAETVTLTVSDNGGALTSGSLSATITPTGGTIAFDLDGVPTDHSINASAQFFPLTQITRIDGYDNAGNFFQMFFSGPVSGPYECGNVYYQDPAGKQWGAGGSIGGTCSVAVTSYGNVGQQIEGSFSASLVAQFGGATGIKSLSSGTFSVAREPN